MPHTCLKRIESWPFLFITVFMSGRAGKTLALPTWACPGVVYLRSCLTANCCCGEIDVMDAAEETVVTGSDGNHW